MPVDEPLYPVNLRVAGKPCLVVGGGTVAAHKVRGLLEAGAKVTVVAPDISPELADLPVTVERRPYRRGEVADYRLVITATDDPAVNRAVFDDGEAAAVWVNAADDPANCSFTLPARVRRGPLLVTFSTGGTSPAVATWLRTRFEREFGPEYGVLVELLGEVRERVRSEGRSTEDLNWQQALESGMLELIREGHLAEARERLEACLSSSSD